MISYLVLCHLYLSLLCRRSLGLSRNGGGTLCDKPKEHLLGQGKASSNNISNTRDSVSSGYPNSEKRVGDTMRSGVSLMKFRGVWIAEEILSRMFDISSQSKQKLRSK